MTDMIESDWFIAISNHDGAYLTLNKEGYVGETCDFSRAVKVRNRGFLEALVDEANDIHNENTRRDDYSVHTIFFLAPK